MGYENRWPTDEEFATFDEDDKKLFYADYYRGGYAYAGYKPTLKQKMKYKLTPYLGYLIGIIALIIVYGLINLVLVGGQSLWHSGEKSRLEKIEAVMSEQKSDISAYETEINNGTISDADYEEYSKIIDEFNENVAEYNELSKKIGTTWYILPIPGSKSH